MPKKFFVSLLFVSLLLSQATFSISQQTSGNTDMMDLAMMLPDSDVVGTMDADRILNIAAPSLLGEDAKKIEHLKNLMRTVENQIGLNPYEIKQIAFGFKMPKESNFDSKELFTKSDFTVLVRTANPNGDLLDRWSKRMDVIAAFKEEQTPSRKYMDDFKRYRDFKSDKATPEKITTVKDKFNESLNKTQEISKMLDAMPKLTTDAKAANNLRAKNKAVADSINKFLAILKADTDTKTFRETSVKLLNRWNAVTLDDAQRTAKLAAITSESKNISPAYKVKFDNAAKIETLVNLIEPAPEFDQQTPVENLNDQINADLDQTLAALGELPATKVKRTASLNSTAENFDILISNLNAKFEALNSLPDLEMPFENTIPPKAKSFYETLKKAETEQTVNGKRLIVIDAQKLDDAPLTADKTTETLAKKEEPLNIAVGFLDERTMAIGFEKSITPFLKRDAGYKNTNAAEMLSSSKNSLMAFAMNSNIARQIAAETAKTAAKPANSDILSTPILSRFTQDINIYGSINYDAGSVTDDITMSLGFFKEKVSELAVPDAAKTSATDDPNVDNTFEIAGYQVGKDIFYDMFNSFKAVQASMTFKFEKKKIAALIRATPRIIDRIKTARAASKKDSLKVAITKSNKLESLPDLITAPQLYIDLAALLNGKS